MPKFYASGIPVPTDPGEVAEVQLGQSIDTDEYWKRFSDAFGWRVEG
jgi:hypothetical protein